MNLKKSDKLIAVGAVIILIIAAIGVIYYSDTDNGVEPPIENEMKIFHVDLGEALEETIKPDNTDYVVNDRIFNDLVYTGVIDIDIDNFKEAIISVEYEDRDFGLFAFLKKNRANTLTVRLLDNVGNEKKSITINGMGNDTITIEGERPLNIADIKAIDKNEARKRLEENLSLTGDTEKYTIEVSVKHGERIFRPLMWLLEKLSTDNFNLEITAKYHSYIIEELETKEDDDENKDTSRQSLYIIPQTYMHMGYPGFH